MVDKETTSQTEVAEVRNEETVVVAPDEGQQLPGDGVAEVKAPETQPEAPKTYSEEEKLTWERDQQSKHDTKVAEINKAHKEATTKLEEDIQKAREVEAVKRDNDWLKSVEDKDGDMDVAKQVLAERKAVRERETGVAKREAKATEIEASQQSALKYLDAQKLAKEHDIPVDVLLQAKSPEEMKVIALTEENKRLKTSGEAGKKRPVTTTDKGIGSGVGTGWRDLSADEKIRQGTK